MARLKKQYTEKIVPELKKQLGLKNDLQVPALKKIVLNMGIGEAVTDSKYIKLAVEELTLIAGQRAVATTARKSVAGFKIRQGQKIGAMVKGSMYTLRMLWLIISDTSMGKTTIIV